MDEDAAQDDICTSHFRSLSLNEDPVDFPVDGQARNRQSKPRSSVPDQQQLPLSPEPVSSTSIVCKCALPEPHAVQVIAEYQLAAQQPLITGGEHQSPSPCFLLSLPDDVIAIIHSFLVCAGPPSFPIPTGLRDGAKLNRTCTRIYWSTLSQQWRHVCVDVSRHIIFFRSEVKQYTYEDLPSEARDMLPDLVAATFTSRTMRDRGRTVGYSRNTRHHNDTKILKDGPEEDILPTCFAPAFREPSKQEVSFSKVVFESDSPIPVFPLKCFHTLRLYASDDSVANLTSLARNLRRFYNPSPLFETLEVHDYKVKFYEPLPQLNQSYGDVIIRHSYFDESLLEEERSVISLIDLNVRIQADWHKPDHGYDDNLERSHPALDRSNRLQQEPSGWFGQPGEQIDTSTIPVQPFPALHHIALQIFQHFFTMGRMEFEFWGPAERPDCRSMWRTYTYWRAGNYGRKPVIVWTSRGTLPPIGDRPIYVEGTTVLAQQL